VVVKAAFGIILISSSILLFAFNIQSVTSEPTTWIVDDDGPADFRTIQEAINAASPGDTIQVTDGRYYEHVVVNKTVSLIGEDKNTTIIDGRSVGTVVSIVTSNVVIRNFTILNSAKDSGFFGVAIYYENNATIENNNIRNNNIGIMVRSSRDTRVDGNEVSDGYGGIIINYSENITVKGNHVSNNSWGVSFYASRNCNFENNAMHDNVYNLGINGENITHFTNSISSSNTVNGNLVYYLTNKRNLDINPSTYPNLGYLALINSSDAVIHDLNVTQNFSGVLLANATHTKVSNVYSARNYVGIIVYLSSNITVETSNILNNTESGIAVSYSENSKIASNTIANQTLQELSNGIELYYSKKITIKANSIFNNKYGMFLGISNENSIYWNNLVDNTYQVGDLYGPSYNNVWDYGYPSGGNYWSDYKGQDLDRDGIGDTVYVIDGNNQDHYPLMNPWILDTTPPVSEISICGISGDDFWFTSSVNVTLSAEDVSGISKIEYSFDNASWVAYATPLTITNEGSTIIYYKSTDKARPPNVERIKSENIRIDTLAPLASITSPLNASEMRSSTVIVVWLGADSTSNISHYKVRLDGGLWINVGTNTTCTFTELGEGTHTIEVEARDNAGLSRRTLVTFVVNTSLLLGPGYIEEVAIVVAIIIALLGFAVYLIKIRRRRQGNQSTPFSPNLRSAMGISFHRMRTFLNNRIWLAFFPQDMRCIG